MTDEARPYVVQITVQLKPGAIERRRRRVSYLRCELARAGYIVSAAVGSDGAWIVAKGGLVRAVHTLSELESFARRALGRRP